MSDVTRTVAYEADATREAASGTVVGLPTGDLRPAGIDPPPGYDRLEPLGEGGMGVVYAAREVAFDREVAIKTLQPRYAQSERAESDFVREVRITARLQHPGIPPVHQTGNLPDGRPFMVMKLVRGRTLSRLLEERGPGTHWVGVFEAVCHAVGYAHSRGVIHRDLKPANVMVGAFGEVQVMDWGLAKVLNAPEFDEPEDRHPDPPPPDTTMSGAFPPTLTGTAKGTPAYMSPEQALGLVGQVNERSDVFSLGAVLLTLLTGKPPYTGGNLFEVVRQAAAADLADAFRRLDGCGASREVVALCKRCLSADPAARPANAEAVAEEVTRIRKAAEQAAHTRRVRRWQVALGGVVLAVLATVGVIGWAVNRDERLQAERLLATREELARTLGAVERHLAAGDMTEAFEGYLQAKELASSDPDPESSVKERLETVRRECRTAIDLFDFHRSYANNTAPEWAAFEKAFTRVGITLDLARPEQTAEQVTRHPFAPAFGDVLKRQGEHDPDPTRRKQLSALVNDARLAALVSVAPDASSAFARQSEGGTRAARSFAPNMFGD